MRSKSVTSDPQHRPWLALYDGGLPPTIARSYPSPLTAFRALVHETPDAPLIHFFDETLTIRDIDTASTELAHRLGIAPGDRVALYLQNVPQFAVALLAIWKARGVMVPLNPMLKAEEVDKLLGDAGAELVVAHESLAANVGDRRTVTTHDTDRAAFGGDLADSTELAAAEPAPGDTAVITYTSGTTGPPKGALNTHANIAFASQVYRDWVTLTSDDVVLGVAPLFHVTGLVAHLGVSFLTGAPLVLAHRFDAATMLAAAARHRATFTVASITAYIALLNHPYAREHDLSTLTKAYSGGAPVPPATVDTLRDVLGVTVRNVYGLTETTSPSHMVPWHRDAPVDAASGALSIGVPVFSTDAYVVGDDDVTRLPPGEAGELVIEGPQVVPGYWQGEEATLPLRTGDVAIMDNDGWFYIVDRKKDQINASGFKVWPREVEDVLYRHEAVREAAVVGVPDAYRGETVQAFVSLKAGADATPAELVAHAREHLAAYKAPREIVILEELPKTASGKILRRELRDQPRPAPS